MKGFQIVICFCLSFIVLGAIHAQIPMTPEEARIQLEEKGISEEDLRERMLEKGYDMDNIRPEQMEEFQAALLLTIEELEQEKIAEEAQIEVPAETAPVEIPEEEKIPEKEIEEEIPKEDVDTLDAEIYGHHLFKNQNLNVFRKSDDIQPPESYILGTGDNITLTIWGLSQYEETFEIASNGFIRPKDMPRIALKGMSFGKAKTLLQDRFRNYYVFRPGEFELTINSPRNITVNVFGEAKQTGSFTIPAINTAFNVLVAVGGPTEIGTVRNIRLISSGREKRFDLYKFMSDPLVAEEFYLNENDFIHIPESERLVEISGAIRRPFKYELIGGENLKALLDYAGGLTFDAYMKDILIARFSNDERVIINLDLRELLSGTDDFILYNGDEITISTIETSAENIVEIIGEVLKPGEYELKPGMRLSDLISISTLKPEAKTDYAYLLRYKLDGTYSFISLDIDEALANVESQANIELRHKDRLTVLSQTSFADTITFSISGAVRSPGEFDFDPTGHVKVDDAILMSGGLKPGAADFAYVIRQNPADPKRMDYIPFNIKTALNDPAGSQNIILQAFDDIRIFDLADFRDNLTIKVSGAVRTPGEFQYAANMTITDALNLAGGLTFSAASNRIDISRIIFSENNPTQVQELSITVDRDLRLITTDKVLDLFPFDHIYVRSVPEFELEKVVTLSGEVRYPGKYSIVRDNERISNLIDRSGGITPEAFPEGAILYRLEDSIGTVVIQLNEALSNRNSPSDLIIKDGDVIEIPKQKDLVTIAGAVNVRELYPDEFIQKGNRINVVYERGKNAKYYIDNYAAGVADNGARRLITVEHPNGRVEKTKNFGVFKVYPKVSKGSKINVGAKPKKPEEVDQEKEPIDWSNVIRDTIAQATAILTLILLIDRTNN